MEYNPFLVPLNANKWQQLGDECCQPLLFLRKLLRILLHFLLVLGHATLHLFDVLSCRQLLGLDASLAKHASNTSFVLHILC